jgi:STE24 endopeptidase
VSRFLLLFLFILWSAWPRDAAPRSDAVARDLVLFFGFFVLLVVVLGTWARSLARRLDDDNLYRNLTRFSRTMHYARMMIPAWFAVGVFALGWKSMVLDVLPPLDRPPFELPGVIVGTLPALIAWMGLWWSQFPAERALREQNILSDINAGEPVHAPPTFRRYFVSNLRLQVLFTLVPVVLILAAHDLALVVMWKAGWLDRAGAEVHAGISMASAALVLLLAPEILRRVLDTRPLPHDALRGRLEAMCRRHRLRYRDILQWGTDHNIGNAAVMGLLPQVRYILLSDLLLEKMDEPEVEAVFAHELGHVVHRHMAWYVVFFMLLMATMAGPAELLLDAIRPYELPPRLPHELVIALGMVGLFFVAFGFLSRRFERQADVFAARTIEQEIRQEIASARGATVERSTLPPLPPAPPPPAPASHVGKDGAAVFARALERVAKINNIPARAWSWCHGSIEGRARAVNDMGADPARTSRFDRAMRRLYVGLLASLVGLGTWAWLILR